MRRVLFIDHARDILGGAELNLVELLEEARGHWETSCACPADGPLAARVHKLGVPRFDHALGGGCGRLRVVGRRFSPLRALAAWLALYRGAVGLDDALARFRPEAVISCTNKDHLCAARACRRYGVPSVWWVNDVVSPDFFPWPVRAAFRRGARRGAARLVAVSGFARQALLREGLPAQQVASILNGIPAGRYAAARGSLRGRLGIPADVPLAGFVGRFTPWKGPEFFLRLAGEFAGAPETRFVLVGQAFNGERDFEAGLRGLAAQGGLGGRVHFVPFQPDIAPSLADLDALVHCSLRPEPFGRVIVEAMAAGVPVLAARAGGVPEIVTDGVDGLLAEPGDLAGYRDRLRLLLADKPRASRLAAAGRDTARERFAIGRVRRQFEEVLEEACGSSF